MIIKSDQNQKFKGKNTKPEQSKHGPLIKLEVRSGTMHGVNVLC